jgi:hypothetical protein
MRMLALLRLVFILSLPFHLAHLHAVAHSPAYSRSPLSISTAAWPKPHFSTADPMPGACFSIFDRTSRNIHMFNLPVQEDFIPGGLRAQTQASSCGWLQARGGDQPKPDWELDEDQAENGDTPSTIMLVAHGANCAYACAICDRSTRS